MPQRHWNIVIYFKLSTVDKDTQKMLYPFTGSYQEATEKAISVLKGFKNHAGYEIHKRGPK